MTAKNLINGCVETIEVVLCCCSAIEVFEEGANGNTSSTFEDNPEETRKCNPKENKTLTVDVMPTPPSKKGAKDGSIKLTINGGSGTVYIKWTGSNGFSSTSQNLYNLAEGAYFYTVTDGCQEVKGDVPLYICSEKPIIISATLVRPCKSSNPVFSTNSVIEIAVTGGFLPYKYQWSNGSKTPTLKNPPIGQYTVTVTDKGGCTKVESYNLGAGQITKIATNQPCAITYFCDLLPAHFVPYQVEPRFDDPNDCRIQNFYCLATGDKVASVKLPFTNLQSDNTNCTLFGICPGTGKKQFIESGFRAKRNVFSKDKNCECYACNELDECVYPNSQRRSLIASVAKKLDIQPAFIQGGCGSNTLCKYDVNCNGTLTTECLPCSKSGLAYNNDVLSSEEQLLGNELFIARQETPNSIRYLIPSSATMMTTMDEYYTLMERETERREVTIEEEFKEYYCVKDCSSGKPIESRVSSEIFNAPTITPNPFSDYINLNYKSDAQCTINIQISNIIGIKILEKVYTVQKGGNVINIDTKAFADGAYILKVLDTQSNQISSYTLIKQ